MSSRSSKPILLVRRGAAVGDFRAVADLLGWSDAADGESGGATGLTPGDADPPPAAGGGKGPVSTTGSPDAAAAYVRARSVMSYSGASSASARGGSEATSASPSKISSTGSAVISPM